MSVSPMHISLHSRKKVIQSIIREQKRIAQSISIIEGTASDESIYAWKTVKALEKKKSFLNEEEHNKDLGLKDDLFNFRDLD
jgi:hypothetical protein